MAELPQNNATADAGSATPSSSSWFKNSVVKLTALAAAAAGVLSPAKADSGQVNNGGPASGAVASATAGAAAGVEAGQKTGGPADTRGGVARTVQVAKDAGALARDEVLNAGDKILSLHPIYGRNEELDKMVKADKARLKDDLGKLDPQQIKEDVRHTAETAATQFGNLAGKVGNVAKDAGALARDEVLNAGDKILSLHPIYGRNEELGKMVEADKTRLKDDLGKLNPRQIQTPQQPFGVDTDVSGSNGGIGFTPDATPAQPGATGSRKGPHH